MQSIIRCEVEGYGIPEHEGYYWQVGQKWKTRGGDTVTIIELDFEDEDFCIMYNSEYDTWVTRAGRESFEKENLHDLVELIEDVSQDSNKELEQETKTEATSTVNTNQVVKLSDFLKEHNAYDSFVEHSKIWWICRSSMNFPYILDIFNAFEWGNTKEGILYWQILDNTFNKISNKEYDMTYFIKNLVIKAKEGSKVKDPEQETQTEPKTEYFVFVQGNKAPKVAHSTLASAEKEAIRLSSKEIGREVSIMTKVKSYKSEVIVKEILC